MTQRIIEKCIVHESGSLHQALETLDRGGIEIAMVVDDNSRLVGTLTDGDARRALLRGATLDSPLRRFVHREFTAVGPSAGREEVIELMQARWINQIPIVDAEGRLLGLHLLRDLLGAVERPNWAVVMAGGRGSRLGSLTDSIPKPMLKVAGRPILERLVLHLIGHGIKKIFLSINYLGHIVQSHFEDGSRFGVSIEYLREDVPLGTGGSLALLPKLPTEPLLVMNGDLVTQANLGALLSFHTQGRRMATVAVRRHFTTIPFGCVNVDGERIVHFEEKPTVNRLVNTGIYVLSPELITRVPKGKDFPLPALIDGCLARKESVGAFEIDEDWIDVGQRDQLKQARGD